MEYRAFRDFVKTFLSGNEKWTVVPVWDEANEDGSSPENDEIDLEQRQGAFSVFMTVSVAELFALYRREGWAAVQIELEERTQYENGTNRNRRRRCEYYESLLDENGRDLFSELRTLRAGLAREKGVPPYIVFVNRTLYEMCLRRPVTMEELLKVYGVGEKNSGKYGEEFLECIRGYVKEQNSENI